MGVTQGIVAKRLELHGLLWQKRVRGGLKQQAGKYEDEDGL